MEASAFDRPMTMETWGELSEDEDGELVDGRLVEEESATIVHETIESMLNALLRAWLGAGRGLVGGSNAKFKVSNRRGRKPDLYLYLPGSKLPRGDAPVIDAVPDLASSVNPIPRSRLARPRLESGETPCGSDPRSWRVPA
jgi:Uma2 family endonuclease